MPLRRYPKPETLFGSSHEAVAALPIELAELIQVVTEKLGHDDQVFLSGLLGPKAFWFRVYGFGGLGFRGLGVTGFIGSQGLGLRARFRIVKFDRRQLSLW